MGNSLSDSKDLLIPFLGTNPENAANFCIACDPGAIPSLAALIVTCAALDAEAWMITR